jgi:hypothetical protein
MDKKGIETYCKKLNVRITEAENLQNSIYEEDFEINFKLWENKVANLLEEYPGKTSAQYSKFNSFFTLVDFTSCTYSSDVKTGLRSSIALLKALEERVKNMKPEEKIVATTTIKSGDPPKRDNLSIKKTNILYDFQVNFGILSAVLGFCLLLITQTIINVYLNESGPDMNLYAGVTVIYAAIIFVWYAQATFYRDVLEYIGAPLRKNIALFSAHALLICVIASSFIILGLYSYETLNIEALFFQMGLIPVFFGVWSLITFFCIGKACEEKGVNRQLYSTASICGLLFGITLMIIPIFIRGLPQ